MVAAVVVTPEDVTAEITGGVVSVCGERVTVVVEVTAPVLLVAVKVKLVVCDTETVLEVSPVTDPMPLSKLREVAPFTDHDKVTGPAVVIEEGEAVKEEMEGRLPP